MTNDDLYAVLGVLPDAEEVVVTAAYRALAQRYHPDKWEGDAGEAHGRMSRINAAYAVLGDRVKRAAYDRTRSHGSQAEFQPDDEQSGAFTSALSETEEKWTLACSIYPDLKILRSRLAGISTSLAFALVVVLLETKAFAQRQTISTHLEEAFLQRYFGTNPKILEYATSLVLAGEKAAAKALNRLIDVLGSDVDPKLIIDRIESEFHLRELQIKREKAQAERDGLEQLKRVVKTSGYYADAYALAKNMGYIPTEVGGGLFTAPEIDIKMPTQESIRLKNSSAFVHWVQQNLCALK